MLFRKSSKFYIKDGNIVWLKDKNLISGVFIKYLFHTRYIEKQLFDTASITTVATYTIESAKKTRVPIPATDEQQKIASFLSTVDTKIEQLRQEKGLAGAVQKRHDAKALQPGNSGLETSRGMSLSRIGIQRKLLGNL